jgi:hypothetical protein
MEIAVIPAFLPAVAGGSAVNIPGSFGLVQLIASAL